MKKELVIFGIGKISEVISYYASEECGFRIAAFCVDEAYKKTTVFKDLPVVSFNEVQEKYPPSKYDMFVAVGYHDLNRLREARCKEAIEKGYTLATIIS